MKLKQNSYYSLTSVKIALVCTALTCQHVSANDKASLILRDSRFKESLAKLTKKYKQVDANSQAMTPVALASDSNNSALTTIANNINTKDVQTLVDQQLPSAVVQDSQIIDGQEPDSQTPVNATDSRFAIGEELVFDILISNSMLGSIFMIKSGDGFQIGLNQLIQLLQLPIEFNTELTSAEGWVFNEKNKFSLKKKDDYSIEITIGNKTNIVPASAVQWREDDVYIDLDMLVAWFSFTYSIDESKLAFNVKSSKQFPVEERLARKNRKLTTQSFNQVSQMPYRETGYALYSPPLFDAQISSRTSSSNVSSQYSILGSHDLAYFNAKYFVTGNDDKTVANKRLTLSRQSNEDNLLGPLKATQFEVGDVIPISGAFSNSSGLSRGIAFSNTALSLSLDQQKVNLIGEVQNDWDVELYKNGILIDQILDIQDGRYAFSDIQLDFGENNFELVFYGPQGQVETRTESYPVDGTTLAKGKFGYQFSFVELGESLFQSNNQQTTDNSEGLRTDLQTSYGVTDWLSFNSGVGQSKPYIGDEVNSYGLGFSSQLFNFGVLSASIGRDSKDNSSQGYGLRTSMLGAAFSFGYNQRLSKPFLNSIEQIQVDSLSAQMTGQLFKSSSTPIQYTNNWTRNEYVGGVNEVLSNSIGFNTKFGSFSHSISKQKVSKSLDSEFVIPVIDFNENVDPTNNTPPLFEQTTGVSGGINYRNNFSGVFARTGLTYTIEPTTEIVSSSVGVSYSFNKSLSTNLDLTYLNLSKSMAAGLNMNWKINDFSISANTRYNETTGWSAGLSARFGFGYAPDANQFFTSRSGLTSAGAVSARVFEDTNLNGVFDSKDQLIKDAEVVSKIGGERRALTNDDGIAVLTGISSLLTTDIVVDSSSLHDPSARSLIPGVGLTSRQGRLDHIEFPVTKTGELEGTLYQRTESGELLPISFAVLQLTDASGNVVDTAQSEFDGYYLFYGVIPGNYRVMIAPASVKRLGLRTALPNYVRLAGGSYVSANDIQLEQRENMSGYSAELGSFNSLPILRAYWSLLAKSGMNIAKLRPFYMTDDESGKYVLRAGFYKDRPSAEVMCNRIKARKLNCNVHDLETKI